MDFTVGDVMQVNVKSVAPNLPLSDLEHAFIEARVGGFPVVDDGVLVGVISRSDIVRRLELETDVAENVSDFYFDESGFHEVAAKSYKQVVERVAERIQTLKVVDMMVHNPLTASPRWLLEQVASIFTLKRIHRLPVIEQDRLVGIITTMDLTKLFADRRVEVAK